ncbi:3-deoxy-7-phosphoheptulonate synthase [Fimbriimonadia bacterium ATM]|nr:MAG: 3-deoxy-7-phosphoheptulonate synthase [Armatimonadota bacterium]MBC6970595.1 3-deoxy-7-phosphoheptulonate synthase [Armatimonadota bacterium]MCE7899460.1 3-deoxy-7-phosphoheptulonate synthase [Armatimonadetes bacterium ATM1]MDL1929189.1 3-deoxy-7-phosphoheptulonate synthase [Fimbriimonadia bacterium ATM]RIJ96518.1 MAG: 3-deoxy-7-phosphoheptulonate synthase [Armatimonadota bacterium]
MPFNPFTDDLRIRAVRPLVPPAVILEEIAASEAALQFVADRRREIADALHGRDPRLVVVVGPCSIHDVEAAEEYGERLLQLSQEVGDRLILVMRTYFEKPRTVGGWKGLINDPDLDGSYHINKGLRMARGLLKRLAEMRVAVAVEFLDTIIPQYLADLVSWAAIGARTTESQVHRELASGLSMPVGFKNSTEGYTRTAVDAVRAAASPHWFPSVTKEGVTAIFQTSGNDACHVILRGGHRTGPNYQREHVNEVVQQLLDHGLPGRVMVDCSHGNSGKIPARQPAVAENVVSQIRDGSNQIFAVMMESFLVEGRQDLSSREPLRYGQSITDGCMGFEETMQVIDLLASAQKQAFVR